MSILNALFDVIRSHHGIDNKFLLSSIVKEKFSLTIDRSVYYCKEFAIRFSKSSSINFSNGVVSLSQLQKFDDRVFIVCVVTPDFNYCLIANSTFLKRISHSSHLLRVDNIRGTFLGSDIARSFEGIENREENISRLYRIHENINFEGNLVRLVEATNNIVPTGHKYSVASQSISDIIDSPQRASKFMLSQDALTLKCELDSKVKKYYNEILLASIIENVNLRGRVIEYIIAGEDQLLREKLIESLSSNSNVLAQLKTKNSLGDFQKIFEDYDTETDVKTKIMFLKSNPKAYNLDKMLEFLSNPRSVFMFYFVGISFDKSVITSLASMFQSQLLDATIVMRHCAGRNSRGATQFDGEAINEILRKNELDIDVEKAVAFLKTIINM